MVYFIRNLLVALKQLGLEGPMFWLLFLVLGVSAVVLLSQKQSRQVAADLFLVFIVIPIWVACKGLAWLVRKAAEIVVATAIYLVGRILLLGIVTYDLVRPRWRRVLLVAFLVWTAIVVAFTPITSLYRLTMQIILVILAFGGLIVIVAGMYQAAYKPGDESSLDDERLWSLGLNKVWTFVKAPFVFLWEFAAAICALIFETLCFFLRRGKDVSIGDSYNSVTTGYNPASGERVKLTSINNEVSRPVSPGQNQMGPLGPQHR